MLYFLINGNKQIVGVTNDGKNADSWAQCSGCDYISRNHIKTFDGAQRIAAGASEISLGKYVAIDNGPNCSPRYDVIKAFEVDEYVSYSFNGDSYPDGKIARISPSGNTITTTNGTTYRRKGDTDSWKKTGGTWTLIHGIRNERNPSF